MLARFFAGLVLTLGVGVLAIVGLGIRDDGDNRDDGEIETVASADTEAAVQQPALVEETVGDAPDAVAPAETTTTTTTTTEPAGPIPDNYGPRRDLVNLDGWINTDFQDIDDFNGQVLVVEMWTFGCFNCQNRIPHTQALYADLADENFDIIGVHAPEFAFEREIPNIEQAVVDLGVTWPVAIDTNRENFSAWQDGGRRFWPRTYVVDQNGDIRFDHIGEGDYEELEQTVKYLLDNPPEPHSAS